MKGKSTASRYAIATRCESPKNNKPKEQIMKISKLARTAAYAALLAATLFASGCATPGTPPPERPWPPPPEDPPPGITIISIDFTEVSDWDEFGSEFWDDLSDVTTWETEWDEWWEDWNEA
jgi:hypothetical protein